MTSPRPDPLVPAEVDLRGLPWMPIDTIRLLDSDLFALSNGDEFKAAVALWCKSWAQQPGGSLPSDDRILAHLSGAKNWNKVKDIAMRGWILCADNRLYHPVVAEKAIEAWDTRIEYRETKDAKTLRQQRWRERCKHLSAELRALGITPPKGASLEKLEQLLVDAKPSTPPSTPTSTVDEGEIGKKRSEVKGSEETKEIKAAAVDQPPLGETPPAAADPIHSRSIELTVLLRKRGASLQANDPRVRQWAESGVTDAQALTALDIAQERRTEQGNAQPINAGYLDAILKDASGQKQKQSNRRRTIHDERADTIAALTGRDRDNGQVIEGYAIPTD